LRRATAELCLRRHRCFASDGAACSQARHRIGAR
jgi:hypothetical protein